MTRLEALRVLNEWAEKGHYVFTKHDLAKLFPQDNSKTLEVGLKRLTKAGILKNICRGIYVNEQASCFDRFTIEHIARALRRGKFNYVSLESILSEYGSISQIPIGRLTVMTTGRKGVYNTSYGVIEFTHTKRSVSDIQRSIKTDPQRPLRIATEKTALRDLKRVGRNTKLIIDEG